MKPIVHGRKWRWATALRGHQNRGRQVHSEEFRRRSSERMRENNPMKDPEVAARVAAAIPKGGYPKCAAGVKAIAEAAMERMGSDRNPMKDPVSKVRATSKMLAGKGKSKTEDWFEKLVSNLPVEWTGDGRLVVAHGDSCRYPDFRVTGQRAVIEVAQSEFFNGQRPETRTESNYGMATVEHYALAGWRCLVLILPQSPYKRKSGTFLHSITSTVGWFIEGRWSGVLSSEGFVRLDPSTGISWSTISPWTMPRRT